MKKIILLIAFLSFCNAYSQNVNKNLSLAEKYNEKASRNYENITTFSHFYNQKEIEENKIQLNINKKEALHYYDIAIKEDTVDCAFLYYRRALLKVNINDRKGAIEDFYQTINKNQDCEIIWQVDPEGLTYGFNSVSNSSLYDEIASLKIHLKDYIGAVQDYTKAIELDDSRDNYDYYKERGKTKILLNDFRGALKDFEHLLSKNQNDYGILELIGNTKFDMKDENSAIYYYTRAIKINNKKEIIFYNRGLCYLNLNKIEEACLDFSRAGELGYKEAYEIIKTKCK